MRIVLSGEGTRGDIQPLIEFGARLRGAGHDALVCGPPDFAPLAAGRCVPFQPLGIDFREFMTAHADLMAGSAIVLIRAAFAQLRAQISARLATLVEVTRGADLVVAGGPDIAASSAAQRNAVAYRYIAYCPALFPSREHAPFVLPWQRMPGWANRLAWPLTMWPLEVTIRRVLAPARRSVGLPPARDMLGLFFGERPILAAESVLARPPADGVWRVEQIPALHPLAGEALPAKLASFLDAGPAPVYFGFGSMPDADAATTTRTILDAVATLGCRAVIGSGWAELGGGALPEGVITAGAVSHPELFARCAAIVHHGGAGTTTNAARSGVPQLLVPHIADQFYWARRVNELGLGPPGLGKRQLRADRLCAALGAMLDNEIVAERAREVGERLRDEARAIDPVAHSLQIEINQKYPCGASNFSLDLAVTQAGWSVGSRFIRSMLETNIVSPRDTSICIQNRSLLGCAHRNGLGGAMTTKLPTGAEKLVQCLEREGVEYIFGLSGGAAMPIFDALVDSKIKLILVRHEQGATHMADGYARATRQAGRRAGDLGPRRDQHRDRPADGADGLGADDRAHRPDHHVDAGQGRLPGSGRHRHHLPGREAQLPGQGRERHPARRARGVPHRHHRPPGPGADRPAQGRDVGALSRRPFVDQVDLPGYHVPGHADPASARSRPPRCWHKSQAPGALRRPRRGDLGRRQGDHRSSPRSCRRPW